MKKFVLSAAVLAIFTAGMTATVGVVAAGDAVACVGVVGDSRQYAATLPQVRYGDHGPHVMGLQLALRRHGHTELRGSGTYADLTLAAVRDFQRKNGITDSGIVGSRTWQALVGRMHVLRTANGAHPVPAFGVRPGEVDRDKMFELNERLVRLGMPGVTDVYGPAAQRAVPDFQDRVGIRASGIVGPRTWRAMDTVVSVSGGWGC